MRIGTWNLEQKWTPAHARVLTDLGCDVWLLTEVRPEVEVPGLGRQSTEACTARGSHWAAILSKRPMRPLPDPHPATAMGCIDGLAVASSVLPWPLSGATDPWQGSNHPERMTRTLEAILGALEGNPVVWGGDWNQPLTGNLSGFSRRAQEMVWGAVKRLDLSVPTADVPGRHDRQNAIDHIGIPSDWEGVSATRFPVHPTLSDHDAYLLEVE